MATQGESWQRYLGKQDRVNRVAIVGGTHGNERTGVILVEHFLVNKSNVNRSSFQTSCTIANPSAVKANTRYVDTDQNRCFSVADLNNTTLCEKTEHVHAKHLNALLGPKDSRTPRTDLLIDLHTTTANTGVVLIFHPRDVFAHMIAAHLIETEGSDVVRAMLWSDGEAALTPTIARSGMTFEVGAVGWGIIDTRLLQLTNKLVQSVLDFVELHNTALATSPSLSTLQPSISTTTSTSTATSVSAATSTSVVVDLAPSATTATVTSTTPHTPTTRKRHKPSPCQLTVFQRVGTVDYPRDKNTHAIIAYVHPTLQNNDFKIELCATTPTFLGLDGTTIYTFDAQTFLATTNTSTATSTTTPAPTITTITSSSSSLSSPPSSTSSSSSLVLSLATTQENLFPTFVNEAAYYEKGIAFVVTKRVVVEY